MVLFTRLHWMVVLALIVGVAGLAAPAWGQESVLLAAAGGDEAPDGAAPAEDADEPVKSLPVEFTIDYVLVTDYVWRGINLSEYRGEGREKLNHQLDLSATANLKDLGLPDFGSVTLDVWFEYYVGNESLDAAADNKLQEVDYTVAWEYEIPKTPLTVEAGWIAYVFPHAGGKAHESFEVYGRVGLDDSKLFGTEDPVLSPSVAYYYDYDSVKAGFLITTIEHEFAMDDLARGAAVLRDITLTPAASFILDNRYLDKAIGPAPGHSRHKSTSLSSVDVGVEAGYDLGKALDLPDDCGSLKLSVFANYSHPLRRDLLANEFYGGLRIGWKW